MSIACCSSACHNVLLRFRSNQQVAASGVTQVRVTPAPEGFPIGALTFAFFDPESTVLLIQRSTRWLQLHQGTVGLGSCCNSWLLLVVLRQLPIQSLSALRLPIAAPSRRFARPWPLKVLSAPQLPRSINRAQGAACAGPSSMSVQHCACQRFAFHVCCAPVGAGSAGAASPVAKMCARALHNAWGTAISHSLRRTSACQSALSVCCRHPQS